MTIFDFFATCYHDFNAQLKVMHRCLFLNLHQHLLRQHQKKKMMNKLMKTTHYGKPR